MPIGPVVSLRCVLVPIPGIPCIKEISPVGKMGNKKKLVEKNKQIRLAAAKKTIEQLDNTRESNDDGTNAPQRIGTI